MPPAKPAPPQPGVAATSPPAAAAEPLIAGRYAVNFARPLADAGGGLPAFVAIDQRDSRAGLMAVQVAPGAPPRLPAFKVLADYLDPRLLIPLSYGVVPAPDGTPRWFIVCTAPPGASVWPPGTESIRPWSDTDLVNRVMRPVAALLQALETRGLTHRGIRPENLFQGLAQGGPLVLGCAWAGPAAYSQPAVFEPPYMAMCAPSARGEGKIADDVYALGVTLLTLALGRVPLAGLDTDTIVRRKLELGCFQALVGEARLSPVIADLASGMMAQDPEHRPTPALLSDPAAARARRVAARPPRRAPRSLAVGDISVFDARSLAYAIAKQPEAGARLVRTGVADHWLRRVLGDTTMAAKIEEVQRIRNAEGGPADAAADARLVLQAVALLDPQAPLCWRGVALWPDAIGTLLVAEPADALTRTRIEEIITDEITFHWGVMRGEHCDPMALRQEGKSQRTLMRLRGWAGGLQRLDYALNPLLPCRSKLIADRPVARVRDLLGSLEAISGQAEARKRPPIDREMAAFIAARTEGRLDRQIARLGDAADPGDVVIEQLTILADLYASAKATPLPGLAAWLAALASPTAKELHNRPAQEARLRAVAEAVPAGDLSTLLRLFTDKASREADDSGYAMALETIRALDARIARLRAGDAARTDTAQRLGQEAAGVLGLTALVAALIDLALA